MTTTPNDGGPAFPIQETIISQGSSGVPASSGMSLRDYFAAAAMTGLCANSDWTAEDASRMANDAGLIADAMLAERAKR